MVAVGIGSMAPHLANDGDGKVHFHLTGSKGFVRSNPQSDKFSIDHFDHVEFYCADATSTYKR